MWLATWASAGTSLRVGMKACEYRMAAEGSRSPRRGRPQWTRIAPQSVSTSRLPAAIVTAATPSPDAQVAPAAHCALPSPALQAQLPSAQQLAPSMQPGSATPPGPAAGSQHGAAVQAPVAQVALPSPALQA